MLTFWEIAASHRPAFLLEGGATIDYRRFVADIHAFEERLGTTRGLIGIACDGHYHQYVAYIAALRRSCPVALLQPGAGAGDAGLSLTWHYRPVDDHLAVGAPSSAPDLHPDLALLLSTSGSTGSRKWVRLSRRNIASNAASIAEYLDLRENDRAPMALPFQYSYGMSVVNTHLGVQGALMLTDRSVVDPRFWTFFRVAGATGLAGVPHTFDLLDQAHVDTASISDLRYMTQAGGRLPPESVQRWATRSAREGWRFFVMYGQTEAAPRIAYLPPEQAAAFPSAIGVAVPGGEMWIAGEDGARLADGETGELVYRGPNTMMGYATSDADLGKGQGAVTLHTGDIARRLPGGLMEIVGRKSRFVKLFGYRIGLDEVEARLRDQGVEAACVALGDRIGVVYATSDPAQTDTAITAILRDWLSLPAGAFFAAAVERLPRLESGKTDYRSIAALLDAATTDQPADIIPEGKPAAAALGRTSAAAEIERLYRDQFGLDAIDPSASFASLGGDSLNYLNIAMGLERILGDAPANWAETPVADLAKRPSKSGVLTGLDTLSAVRALAIVLIVGSHFHAWRYGGGGAFALLMAAGWTFSAFTLSAVVKAGSAQPVLALVGRIAAITLAYTALNKLATGHGDWPAFLMIGNWISPSTPGSAWFIEVYVQIFLGLAALLSMSRVRRRVAANAFAVFMGGAALFAVIAAVSDVLVDNHPLFRRLPHLMAWIVLVGAAAERAGSLRQRIAVSAVFLLGSWQFAEFAHLGPWFFVGAGLALIWIRQVPVPRLALPPIRIVASASLIIYLTHFQFASVAEKIGIETPLAWVGAALAGGVIVWRLLDSIERRARRAFRGGAHMSAALRRSS